MQVVVEQQSNQNEHHTTFCEIRDAGKVGGEVLGHRDHLACGSYESDGLDDGESIASIVLAELTVAIEAVFWFISPGSVAPSFGCQVLKLRHHAI